MCVFQLTCLVVAVDASKASPASRDAYSAIATKGALACVISTLTDPFSSAGYTFLSGVCHCLMKPAEASGLIPKSPARFSSSIISFFVSEGVSTAHPKHSMPYLARCSVVAWNRPRHSQHRAHFASEGLLMRIRDAVDLCSAWDTHGRNRGWYSATPHHDTHSALSFREP